MKNKCFKSNPQKMGHKDHKFGDKALMSISERKALSLGEFPFYSVFQRHPFLEFLLCFLNKMSFLHPQINFFPILFLFSFSHYFSLCLLPLATTFC
jgi:hypothetical protein